MRRGLRAFTRWLLAIGLDLSCCRRQWRGGSQESARNFQGLHPEVELESASRSDVTACQYPACFSQNPRIRLYAAPAGGSCGEGLVVMDQRCCCAANHSRADVRFRLTSELSLGRAWMPPAALPVWGI